MGTKKGILATLALGLSLAGAAAVATSASSGICAENDQVRGSARETADAQAILVQAGYLAPGDYRKGENDASTRAALRNFQSRHGLAPTGAMDYETMTQLSSHAGTTDRDDDLLADATAPGGLVLPGVRFAPDTAHLTPGARVALDHLAKSLRASPDARLLVSGHTDSTNTDAHNRTLSKERAAAVCEYLVDQGVASSRLQEKGYGESRPIADNATAAGRATNRRVTITRID